MLSIRLMFLCSFLAFFLFQTANAGGSAPASQSHYRKMDYCHFVVERASAWRELDPTKILDSDYIHEQRKRVSWLGLHLLTFKGQQSLQKALRKRTQYSSDVWEIFDQHLKEFGIPGRLQNLEKIAERLSRVTTLRGERKLMKEGVNPWVDHPFLGSFLSQPREFPRCWGCLDIRADYNPDIIGGMFATVSHILDEVVSSAASLRPRYSSEPMNPFSETPHLLFHAFVLDRIIAGSNEERDLEMKLAQVVEYFGESAIEHLTRRIDVREHFPLTRESILDNLNLMYVLATFKPQFFLNMNQANTNTRLQAYVLEAVNHPDSEIRQLAALILIRLAEANPFQLMGEFFRSVSQGRDAAEAKFKELQAKKGPLSGIHETIREYLNQMLSEKKVWDPSDPDDQIHKGTLLLLIIVYKKSLIASRLSEEEISERLQISQLVFPRETIDQLEEIISGHMANQFLGD